MKIGGQLPGLPKAEDDELNLAFSKESFKKAVAEVRRERGIDPRTATQLWARIHRKLLVHPQVKLTLSLPDLTSHSRPTVSRTSLEFGLRWVFFYPSVPGHDWSFVQGLVYDDWDAWQRSTIPKNLSRAPGTPAHMPQLTRDQRIFEKDLRAWVQQYSAVTADDIIKLRMACGLMDLWDVLLLEHLLFNKPFHEWAAFSPRAGIGIEWDRSNGRQLYAKIYRNTTIRAIKKQRDPRGRRFITAAATMIHPLQKVPGTRVRICGDHIRVGPLPRTSAYEILLRLWPRILVLQKQLPGLKKIRLKRNLGRDKAYSRKMAHGKPARVAAEETRALFLDQTQVSSDALRQSAYRLKKRQS